jgi:hypothetical protein
VECNEKFLREMFASPYGETVGRAILERLDHGLTVTVEEASGERLVLNDQPNVVRLLVERFGWRVDLNSSVSPSSVTSTVATRRQ